MGTVALTVKNYFERTAADRTDGRPTSTGAVR